MFPSFSLIALVAIGGAVGSVCRYLVGFLLSNLFGTAYPYGTLFVNVLGSFLIGMVSAILVLRCPDPRTAALLIAGFLGGFTTFSSFINEAFQFLLTGREATGLGYMVLQLIGGLTAVTAGAFAGKYL